MVSSLVGALCPEPHKVTSGLELYLYGHAKVSGGCHQQGYTKFTKSTVYMILAIYVKNAQLLNSTGSELTKQLQLMCTPVLLKRVRNVWLNKTIKSWYHAKFQRSLSNKLLVVFLKASNKRHI